MKLYVPLLLIILGINVSFTQSYSLNFDGSNDYVRVDNQPNLYPNQITLAAWINPSSLGSNDYLISTKQGGGYSLGINITTGGTNNPNKISARCRVNGTYYNIYGTTDIPLDTWSHVALTYDGTKFEIFVNANEENSFVVNGNLDTSSSPLYIGAESNGLTPDPASHYNGLIDNVAIFDTPLSAREIEELMNGQIDSNHSKWNNLEGFWQFNEGTGSTTADVSTNNFSATLINGTAWELNIPLNIKEITQVNSFNTWEGDNGGLIKSPDPAGITYNSLTNKLLIVDSEINEYVSINPNDKNVFEIPTNGSELINSYLGDSDLTDNFFKEPTGITFDPDEDDQLYFVSNDNHRSISRLDANFTFEDRTIPADDCDHCLGKDPEGITCDPDNNLIYVADGHDGSSSILVYDYDLNIIEDSSFSVADRIFDPEGITLHPVTKNLFIVYGDGKRIFEYTTDGVYVAEYDISDFDPTPVAAQGLTFGPSSDGCGYSLYIADGGIDNNNNNGGETVSKDGRIYEAKIEESISNTNFALDFDGANDYVTVEYQSNLYPNQITLAAWINPSSLGSNDYLISTKQGGGYSLGINITTGGTNNPNKISARCRVNGTYYNIYGTTDIPLNTWSHVALTYDGTEFEIFVNGIKENDLIINGSLDASSVDSPLYIGTESNGTTPDPAGHYNGLMDDVAIFDVSLNSSEIQELMNGQIDSNHSKWNNLEGFWQFNEGGGFFTFDSNCKSNNGKLVNGVTFIQNNNTTNSSSAKYFEDLKDNDSNVSTDYQNYPNPFSNETIISINPQIKSNTKVLIYDMSGRKVKTLTYQYSSKKDNKIYWNGEDDSGKLLINGIYIGIIQSGTSSTISKKIVINR